MKIGKWVAGGLDRFNRRAMRDPAIAEDAVRSVEGVANRMPSRRASLMVAALIKLTESRLAAGLNDEALTSADEAISHGGSRTDRKWLDVEQNVGVALSLRSTILERLERPEDALASAEAAAEHMRQLIELDPVRFQPLHAEKLTAVAETLCNQGRSGEAMAKVEHALTVLRGLAGDQDAVLARALRVLATELGKAERYQDMLRAMAEEIELYRRLRGIPKSFLADRLRIHAAVLRLTGSPEEALRVVDESLALWDRLDEPSREEGTALARRVRGECLDDVAG